MDEVEGVGAANIEQWETIFSGFALTYTATDANVLQPTFQYRFRVRAISEYSKESSFSTVSVYYAAALPEQITFPTTVFTTIEKDALTLTWDLPSIDTSL